MSTTKDPQQKKAPVIQRGRARCQSEGGQSHGVLLSVLWFLMIPNKPQAFPWLTFSCHRISHHYVDSPGAKAQNANIFS